ncbi:Protein of unknown function [Terribacillus aidingensis]|uniref:DUF4227 domain-containing protein n=1 Tax=Terribacillus aidingensis TaxID=586416 RepID=A0A285NM00_9BACI|nr:DUF4227 family protein [Terribacillus aidingensis]SNZ10485.1 Protein of unknown function [Terribacillus aidingensis]
MKRFIFDTGKLLLVFVACSAFFYFGLRFIHSEYESYHRYDPPEGNAVKVASMEQENSLVDRMTLFFRLGE